MGFKEVHRKVFGLLILCFVQQPDITAPGVNILVATSPLDTCAENGYLMQSGTSIATPHVAGIVALLKALHPSWSPAAIKSALITTGRTSHTLSFPKNI